MRRRSEESRASCGNKKSVRARDISPISQKSLVYVMRFGESEQKHDADEKNMLIAIPARIKVVAPRLSREKIYNDSATKDPAARAEKATEV